MRVLKGLNRVASLRWWQVLAVVIILVASITFVPVSLGEELTDNEKAMLVIQAFKDRGLPDGMQILPAVDEVAIYRIHWKSGNTTGYSDWAGIDKWSESRVWRDYIVEQGDE